MSHSNVAFDAAEAPLPASAGVTMGVKVMLIGGILVSIMQGAFTMASSGYGRVWPSEASAKLDLPPAHLQP
ncbi:MAG: hypothetical protein JO324_05180 [Candidatus Eremiobacteraeota bacterium]|nr:hypothetical protein [Candidatus Eremiobacteraeota bacterium]